MLYKYNNKINQCTGVIDNHRDGTSVFAFFPSGSVIFYFPSQFPLTYFTLSGLQKNVIGLKKHQKKVSIYVERYRKVRDVCPVTCGTCPFV